MTGSVKLSRLSWLVIYGLVTTVATASELPETTHDGLVLQEDAEVGAAYVRPGASLAPYGRLLLLDCYVAFSKDWQKAHNRDAISLGQRVSADDMAEIKEKMAAEFRKIFTEELAEEGGFAIVEAVAPDVLILRPAIINLNPVAPDVGSPHWSHTLVTSVGQMTLFLELYDGPTGEIIARILDPESGDRGGMAMEANRATNKRETDRILRDWADQLREALTSMQAH